jgi:hypothetical protein
MSTPVTQDAMKELFGNHMPIPAATILIRQGQDQPLTNDEMWKQLREIAGRWTIRRAEETVRIEAESHTVAEEYRLQWIVDNMATIGLDH